MDIIYGVNHKYVKYLYVSLCSLLESNQENGFHIHLLTPDLTGEDEKILLRLLSRYHSKMHIYYVDASLFSRYLYGANTIETFLRLLAPWVLPDNIAVSMYLDVDTFIKGDIRELFSLDMSEHVLAACPDYHVTAETLKERNDLFKRKEDFSYYNAGVMVMNLEYLRNNYSLDDFMLVVEKFGNRLYFADQDVLNCLFFDKILRLDGSRYNCLVETLKMDADFEQIVEDARIIHYAGGAPWCVGRNGRCDIELWWKMAECTPFIDEIKKEMFENVTKRQDFTSKLYLLHRSYLLYQEQGKKLSRMPAFADKKNIAVYGAGEWAERLIKEIENSGLVLQYLFDRAKTGSLGSYEILNPDELSKAENCDVLIITPLRGFEAIVGYAKGKVHCEIISILDCFR